MNIDNNGKVGYLSRDTSNLYNVKPLTKDENQELFIQWHDNNDESARDKIILGNILPLNEKKSIILYKIYNNQP